MHNKTTGTMIMPVVLQLYSLSLLRTFLDKF